jgi:nickel-dependent lactate racemase
MTSYSVPYGRTTQTFHLPTGQSADIILSPEASALPVSAVQEEIRLALSNPIDGGPLSAHRTARSVAIAVNDKTRPVPYDLMLPPLLAHLEELGIQPESIHFFIANGTHIPMPPAEYARILPPEIIARYPIHSHSCDEGENLVSLGSTSRGTEIWANKQFYESDLKIVTGNIEPHHFAGFSGGAKTASIGVCGRKTITQNHIMLVDPNSMIGIYETNPLRQDIEEIGDRIGIHYALNFVMSGEREIAGVLFGTPRVVMQSGIPLARQICQTPVHGSYDLVIASAGGHPKDINLYQAQKAMTHASLLTRPGGIIILVAACPEGSGSASYEAYIQKMSSHAQVLEKFLEDGFKVGPHKSFQIARIATQFGIVLVSEIPPELVQKLLLKSAKDTQQAVDEALAQLPGAARIAVLPHATSTIPILA